MHIGCSIVYIFMLVLIFIDSDAELIGIHSTLLNKSNF
jgi:hypothetical protein